MDTREALGVLGLSSGATLTEARAAYRSLVRVQHPDVAGEASTDQAARLNQAFAILRSVAAQSGSETIDLPETEPPPAPTPDASRRGRSAFEEAVEAELADGDTVLVRAPAEETFAALFEAAGRIGHIAYFDRQLGIIETIVRFEGGPSCSLLVTLQGRVEGTEAFCTLESIEAAPTPPARPVVEALVEALSAPRQQD